MSASRSEWQETSPTSRRSRTRCSSFANGYPISGRVLQSTISLSPGRVALCASNGRFRSVRIGSNISKPYSELDLSNLFDEDLIWRRRELSDMKAAVRSADVAAKSALLRAISLWYPHWEGYVRVRANRYFEYLTIRRKPYVELERQIYVNTFLGRLNSPHQSRVSLERRCSLVNEILDGKNGTFRDVNLRLLIIIEIDTDTIKEICLICSVDSSHFEERRIFIDQIIVNRRNAIAHGQQSSSERTKSTFW